MEVSADEPEADDTNSTNDTVSTEQSLDQQANESTLEAENVRIPYIICDVNSSIAEFCVVITVGYT